MLAEALGLQCSCTYKQGDSMERRFVMVRVGGASVTLLLTEEGFGKAHSASLEGSFNL